MRGAAFSIDKTLLLGDLVDVRVRKRAVVLHSFACRDEAMQSWRDAGPGHRLVFVLGMLDLAGRSDENSPMGMDQMPSRTQWFNPDDSSQKGAT